MKIAYDELLSSNVWDKRFDLPCVPTDLNPHIYAAYAIRVLESQSRLDGLAPYTYQWARGPLDSQNEELSHSGAAALREHYADTFLKSCEKSPGLITTYPGGGPSSYDDAHGAAFLNPGFASRCIDRLSRHDGAYTDETDSEEKNVYRFPFFLPALKAHAGFRVGILTQLQFALALLFKFFFPTKGEYSGHLLLWLSFPAMGKFPISGAAIEFCTKRWVSQGLSPKKIFSESYLTGCPWFSEWARGDWE